MSAMKSPQAFCALAMTCSLFSPAFAAEEPLVRVAILQEVPNARLTILAPCRATDLEKGTLVKQWPELKWQQVESGPSGLMIGQTEIHTDVLLLEPTRDAIIRINARPYRGTLILYRTARGKVTIVNRLGLEEYLVGALASEVGQGWPMEALKAHAIVSRTVVAHRIWIQRGQPFDVSPATHLYYGAQAEREDASAAVRATEGQVLSFNGELFSASFSTNCGGHTENASELWDMQGSVIAPLKGRPDPYCRDMKHYRWEANVGTKTFMEKLGDFSKQIGELRDCQVVERNASGRVRSVLLVGTDGSVTIPGRTFRERIGSDRLKSLNFTVTVSPAGISFSGFGWGHGVGLCQWGTYGMAIQNHTMDEILNFYFPGAKRRPLKGLPG